MARLRTHNRRARKAEGRRVVAAVRERDLQVYYAFIRSMRRGYYADRVRAYREMYPGYAGLWASLVDRVLGPPGVGVSNGN